jgi:hypothetical protein
MRFAPSCPRRQHGAMRPPTAARLLILLLVAGASRAADPVTVYRCTDAQGHVTLGDVPCPQGSTQQTLAMQRPVDAPPPPPRAEPPSPADEAPSVKQVVVVHTPRPMYECSTPDGERYTSDDGDGNPRWVPLWTLGYRGGHGPTPDAGRRGTREAGSVWSRVGAPPPERRGDLDRPPRPPHGARAYGAGTWIRDTCHALPQGEVCARLVDRREEIRQRFFNAQESERDTLRREERGINERLAADCGRR